MSVFKDVSIETIKRMPESAARELLRFIIPEEEISDEERQEIHMIRYEMKRGEKFRLDDVLDELNV